MGKAAASWQTEELRVRLKRSGLASYSTVDNLWTSSVHSLLLRSSFHAPKGTKFDWDSFMIGIVGLELSTLS